MKALISAVCMLVVGIAADAAVELKPNQDKPVELVLESARGQAFLAEMPQEFCGQMKFDTSWEHANDSGGNFSHTFLLNEGPPCSYLDGYEEYETWNADLVETYELWHVWYHDYPEVYREREILQTNNTSLWFPWLNGSTFYRMSEPRLEARLSSKVRLQLRTGGKSGSKLKHLYSLQTSMRAHLQLTADDIPQPADPYPVHPSHIRINGCAWLDTNGVGYAMFPDNSTVDVTPSAGGSLYGFTLSVAKYKSSFSIGLDMPYPGLTNQPPSLNGDYGHAWWKFASEAPDDGIGRFLGPQYSQFIGVAAGYYPTNMLTLWLLVGAFDGVVDAPERNGKVSAPDAAKSFEIGFDDLIKGLMYTYAISNSPGTWSALTHNCVHAARAAGNAARVETPFAIFPQSLGEHFLLEQQGQEP